ncbi:MAG: tyrosine-type recombinase/integrase [Candidatus Pacebacteria bacterium]|nr:tyrosine-type recombinase/integrase [Candidatus Paceibacterota bacterium]
MPRQYLLRRGIVFHLSQFDQTPLCIPDFRFHDLRHDFCSRLVQSGQPLHVVSELAGHQDIKTTQRYAHLSPEVKRQAISALDRPDHDSVGYILATEKQKDLQQKP